MPLVLLIRFGDSSCSYSGSLLWIGSSLDTRLFGLLPIMLYWLIAIGSTLASFAFEYACIIIDTRQMTRCYGLDRIFFMICSVHNHDGYSSLLAHFFQVIVRYSSLSAHFLLMICFVVVGLLPCIGSYMVVILLKAVWRPNGHF